MRQDLSITGDSPTAQLRCRLCHAGALLAVNPQTAGRPCLSHGMHLRLCMHVRFCCGGAVLLLTM